MQFSIFNVLFKCTKDMFTWKKLWWTVCVYWVQLWRGTFFAVCMMVAAMTVLIIPALLNPEALQAFNDSEFGLKALMHVGYSAHYWTENLLALGVGLLVLWGMGLVFGAFYVQYHAMYRKGYRSFDRHFFKPQVERFWSFGFWKPAILTLVIGVLIGFVVGFVLGWFDVLEIVISLIGFLVGLGLFHIFLHGGTWGFVPVLRNKQP